MTPIEKDNAEYLQACERIQERDPLYRELVVRIAKDVSWGEAVPDASYNPLGDHPGIGPSTLPLARAFARRVIVELA